MLNFSEKLQKKMYERSLFCVGLDPSMDNLASWGLPSTAMGAHEFCKRILDAALNEVNIFKPQYAFFEQFGPEGLKILCDVISSIKKSGAVCILDCKKSDIGSTMAAYGTATLSNEGTFKADAITVTPYLGFKALKPVFLQAQSVGAAIFIVVRSSNPEGGEIQTARLNDGRTVSEALADEIQAENSKTLNKKTLGAVIGATLKAEDLNNRRIIRKLKDSWILAPGVGAQGATIESVKTLFKSQVKNVIPSASRSLYTEGYEKATLQKCIRRYKEESLKLLEIVNRG